MQSKFNRTDFLRGDQFLFRASGITRTDLLKDSAFAASDRLLGSRSPSPMGHKDFLTFEGAISTSGAKKHLVVCCYEVKFNMFVVHCN